MAARLRSLLAAATFLSQLLPVFAEAHVSNPDMPWPSARCYGRRHVEGVPHVALSGTGTWKGWVEVGVLDFKLVRRKLWAILPAGVGADDAEPAPLLLSFHGQAFTAEESANIHNYSRLGLKHGFVIAHLQGMNDSDPAGLAMGPGWNTGTAGDSSVCVPRLTSNWTSCYKSCEALGRCGPCNWSTCYDEARFAQAAIERLGDLRCLDLSRVYLQGESNGGMAVHHLTSAMPGRFAAVVPWFGLPLLGYAEGKDFQLFRSLAKSQQTAMLQLHGRQDNVIPPSGGLSDQGWIYESLPRVQSAWAAVHGCESRTQRLETPWDGGSRDFKCEEYPRCKTGRRVMRCMYNGTHLDFPENSLGEEVTVWFMLQFRLRGQPPSREAAGPIAL